MQPSRTFSMQTPTWDVMVQFLSICVILYLQPSRTFSLQTPTWDVMVQFLAFVLNLQPSRTFSLQTPTWDVMVQFQSFCDKYQPSRTFSSKSLPGIVYLQMCFLEKGWKLLFGTLLTNLHLWTSATVYSCICRIIMYSVAGGGGQLSERGFTPLQKKSECQRMVIQFADIYKILSDDQFS